MGRTQQTHITNVTNKVIPQHVKPPMLSRYRDSCPESGCAGGCGFPVITAILGGWGGLVTTAMCPPEDPMTSVAGTDTLVAWAKGTSTELSYAVEATYGSSMGAEGPECDAVAVVASGVSDISRVPSARTVSRRRTREPKASVTYVSFSDTICFPL
jgi:hypothetical protein